MLFAVVHVPLLVNIHNDTCTNYSHWCTPIQVVGMQQATPHLISTYTNTQMHIQTCSCIHKTKVVSYIPPNEFGQEGWAFYLRESDVIGKLTAVDKTCDTSALEAAKSANDPLTIMKATLTVCIFPYIHTCVSRAHVYVDSKAKTQIHACMCTYINQQTNCRPWKMLIKCGAFLHLPHQTTPL